LTVPGILDQLFDALKSSSVDLRTGAVHVLSSIAAGTPKQKEFIVGNADYLDLLFLIGVDDKDLEVTEREYLEGRM